MSKANISINHERFTATKSLLAAGLLRLFTAGKQVTIAKSLKKAGTKTKRSRGGC